MNSYGYANGLKRWVFAIIKANAIALDPAGFLTSATDSFTVDAASQINSSGYTCDTRGRTTNLPGHTLGWDGADRLTGLDGVSFGYNGRNEIVSRIEGEATTRYYHNHALGLSPIVAEQQSANFTRYYVYFPSGKLLYSIDPQNGNAVSYYHGDQIGSTLALSDGAGAVTDRYAYSPFGELLGHTGSSIQPYTFVGIFGVRQEGDLYQMRLRYYDPATAKFLSRESIWPQIEKPNALNVYQYANNQPTLWVDFFGTNPVLTKTADGNWKGNNTGIVHTGGYLKSLSREVQASNDPHRDPGYKMVGDHTSTDLVYTGGWGQVVADPDKGEYVVVSGETIVIDFVTTMHVTYCKVYALIQSNRDVGIEVDPNGSVKTRICP